MTLIVVLFFALALLVALYAVWAVRRPGGTDDTGPRQGKAGGRAADRKAAQAGRAQFMLLGHLSKLNGRVLPAHIQQARAEMRLLGLDEHDCQAAIAAFNQGKGMELKALQRDMQRAFSQDLAAEQLLLSAWRQIWAQGYAGKVQYQALRQCADWLSVSIERLLQLEQQVKPRPQRISSMGVRLGEREQALRLLGLEPPIEDFARVRQAYRKLLSDNHPDRLIGAGASDDQVQQANEKTRALHEAYRLLRKHHQSR